MDKVELMTVGMTSKRLPLPDLSEIRIADSDGHIIA
jgi:hypothetical protein